MAYGLTNDGFVIKPTEVIKADMESSTRLKFGASVPLGERTLLGHLVGLQAAAVGEIWEVTQEIVSSDDPDQATGARLTAIGSYTGTTPQPERRSQVTLSLTGDPATLVDAASRAATASTEREFQTLADATLVALATRASTTAYVVGEVLTNVGRVYVVITAGTTGNLAAAPTGTSDDYTDGTVHWRYVGEGSAAVDAPAESVESGEITAASGDVVDITTPISGWLGVRNLEDAIIGRAAETDGEFRVRRDLELSTGGSTPVDAIRADILQVTGVTSVTVFVNFSDVTDVDGMPPHSVEVLVRGGVAQDIYDALLASVAAGIQTHGNQTGSAVDSESNSHVIKFSRPDEIEIWIEVTLTYDARLYPDNGDDQVAEAIVDFGNAQDGGHDAYPFTLGAQSLSVVGVVNVTAVLVDDVDPPLGTTPFAIALRELGTYDVARVVVNSSATTP